MTELENKKVCMKKHNILYRVLIDWIEYDNKLEYKREIKPINIAQLRN